MRLAMIAGAVLLAACQQPLPDGGTDESGGATVPVGKDDTCDAAEYAWLVGQNMAAVTLPADLPHRLYRESDIVTREYRPERLNGVADAGGTIRRLWCG